MLSLLLACRNGTDSPDGGEPVIALADCVGTMLFDVGVDNIIDGVWVFTYNNQGEPASATYDSKVDGLVDSRMDYVYEGDLLVERWWDGDNNGQVDTTTWYFYSDGDLIESREDQTQDGVADKRSVWEFEDGLKQVQRNLNGPELNDLIEEGYYSWGETSDGLVYQESILWHSAKDTGDTLVSYQYDEALLPVVEEIDKDLDGVIEQREQYTWDDMGRKLTTDKDNNADGLVDYRSSWSYVCDH